MKLAFVSVDSRRDSDFDFDRLDVQVLCLGRFDRDPVREPCAKRALLGLVP